MGGCFGCLCKDIVTRKKLRDCNKDNVSLFTLKGLVCLCKLIDVYDGDTCTIVILTSMCTSGCTSKSPTAFKLRLAHIDTPELKSHTSLSIRAKNKLIQLATNCDLDTYKEYTKQEYKSMLDKNTKCCVVECGEFDKYGRLLGILHTIDSVSKIGPTTNINEQLIQLGLAKRYEGKTKEDWV